MDRRAFLGTIAGGLLAAPVAARAQSTGKLPRVGILTPGNAVPTEDLVQAFRAGMRELGYIEGHNIILERRFGGDKPERLSEAAGELVRSKVDVIVAATDLAIAAVKQQT